MYKLLLLFLILIPPVSAWQWDTHQNTIEYIYLSLPIETQSKLNLTKLKEPIYSALEAKQAPLSVSIGFSLKLLASTQKVVPT